MEANWTALLRRSFYERKEKMKKVFMFVLALTLAVFATSAAAQTTTTGSIEGLVTDPNGAVVKGATVTATSPNLISPQTATTGDSGRYQISNLPPGKYKITVEGSNFAKFDQADISVNLGRTATGDAQLQLPGAPVTVTAPGGTAA